MVAAGTVFRSNNINLKNKYQVRVKHRLEMVMTDYHKKKQIIGKLNKPRHMIPQGKTRGGMKKKYIYNFNTTTTPFNPGSPKN